MPPPSRSTGVASPCQTHDSRGMHTTTSRRCIFCALDKQRRLAERKSRTPATRERMKAKRG